MQPNTICSGCFAAFQVLKMQRCLAGVEHPCSPSRWGSTTWGPRKPAGVRLLQEVSVLPTAGIVHLQFDRGGVHRLGFSCHLHGDIVLRLGDQDHLLVDRLPPGGHPLVLGDVTLLLEDGGQLMGGGARGPAWG